MRRYSWTAAVVVVLILAVISPVLAQGSWLESRILSWDGAKWTRLSKGELSGAAGVGSVVSGKCTAIESGIGPLHQTTLTLTLSGTNDIDVADGAKTTGVKIYDFPAGRIAVIGATINASIVAGPTDGFNANANDIFYVGVGTVDGTQAADADLSTTEQDIIAKTTIDTDSGAGANTQLTNAWKAALATMAQWDGTTTAVDLYVNVAVPAASNAKATTHAITGTLTVTWINLGDY